MYWKGLGNSLGEALGGLTTNYVQTQNTLQQQEQERAQREADNAFRQQQHAEAVRQFDTNLKFQRDNQTFQYLNSRRSQVAELLQNGGYAPGSLEYERAKAALQNTDKLLGKVVRGTELGQDEMGQYDAMLDSLGGLTAIGASALGTDAERAREQGLTRGDLTNAGLAVDVTVAQATQDDKIASSGLAVEGQRLDNAGKGSQNTILAADADVATRTTDARVTTVNNQAAQSGVNLELSQEELGKIKATSASTINAINSTNDLNVARNAIYKGLLNYEGAARQAEYLGSISAQGGIGAALVQQMVDSGDLPPAVAEAVKTRAGRVDTTEQAQADTAKANARTATVGAEVAENTKDAQIATIKTQADAAAFSLDRARQMLPMELDSARIAVDMATEQLGAFREQRPYNLAALKTQVARAEFDLQHAQNLAPYQIEQAQLGIRELQSTIRVMEATEGAQITTANANAVSAQGQAELTTLQVQQVTATAASTIERINAENKLSTATAIAGQGLVDFQAGAQRVEYLARIASSGFMGIESIKKLQAQGKITAAEANRAIQAARQQQMLTNNAVGTSNTQYQMLQREAAKQVAADGNQVNDPKAMQQSLTEMRKINSENLRAAQANYKTVMARYFPNAKISADKWDPAQYQTLIGNANLTPEQRAEVDAAAGALQMYTDTSKDLSTAFAQVASKGRLDPALAERLGFWTSPDPIPVTTTSSAGGSTPNGGNYGYTTRNGITYVGNFTGGAVPRSFNETARKEIAASAARLGVDPNALAAVISFETGGTFSPSIKNPNSSGSGLIQFMEATAKDMGTTTAALRQMSFAQQMKYVERYLKGRGIGPGSSMADIYQAVAGSGYRRGTEAYRLNAVWDSNNNDVVEAHEQTNNPAFAAHVRPYFGAPQGGQTASAPTRTSSPKVTSVPGIVGVSLTERSLAALRAADRQVAGVPQKDRAAKMRQVFPVVARQLSQELGRTITARDVEAWLNSYGGRL